MDMFTKGKNLSKEQRPRTDTGWARRGTQKMK